MTLKSTIDNQLKTDYVLKMYPTFNRNRQTEYRTLGDGMDDSLLNLTENPAKLKININPTDETLASFQPIEPKSEIINLIPKYIPKERKQPKFLIGKPKEPKFVPYEPYKAAIKPIVPKRNQTKLPMMKSSRNNVEIQKLVTQMTEMRMVELNKAKKEAVENEENLITKKQWEKEKQAYETDIKNLRETNSHLENQLKFQAQVNSELKTLLVAAVGEDLETRVQHLTEDKLQLARALLNSANHLTSHQEQTEWLSGQCEVWRSKFLASSLMVEELARWKSALQTRINDLQSIIKSLLEERRKVHDKNLKTYCFLNGIAQRIGDEKIDLNPLKDCNIIVLANTNCNLSKQIGEIYQIDTNYWGTLFDNCLKLSQVTTIEKNASKLLQNPVTIPTKQEAICNALRGTAMSLSGEQIYLQHPSDRATCCAHCKGEIKDI